MRPNAVSFLLWGMIGIAHGHGHLDMRCSGSGLRFPARGLEGEAVPRSGSGPLSVGSCHDMSLQDRALRRVKQDPIIDPPRPHLLYGYRCH